MVWSFLGSGNGNGMHDGAKAMLKRRIRKKKIQIEGEITQCVANVTVVNFCNERQDREHATYMIVRQVKQVFHLVNVEDINRCSKKYNKKIHEIHFMQSVDSVSPRDFSLI
jgi:hypothetical protein